MNICVSQVKCGNMIPRAVYIQASYKHLIHDAFKEGQ